MFEQSSRTHFGAKLTVLPTTLQYVAEPRVGDGPAGPTAQVPVLQLHAPSAMLDIARTLDGGNVRLGCLCADNARIGVAMAYLPGHFAMAMFDHGDPRCVEIANAALTSGQMTVMLRDEANPMAVRVRVTELMRRVLLDSKSAPPASFSQFVECANSVTNLLQDPEAFVEMGVDPHSLQTITLSVCAPAVHADVSVDIVHASRLN